MLGQETLKNRLVNANTSTLVLQGKQGSGKTEIAKWMSQEIGYALYLLEDTKVDNIRDLSNFALTTSVPTIYYIKNGDKLTNGAQNALLKLSEEPPEHSIIMIGVRDVNSLLKTILSRSTMYQMEQYTKEQLQEFSKGMDLPEWVIEVSDTIGEVLEYRENLEQYADDYITAQTVVTKIGHASLQNVMNITEKVEKGYEVQFTTFILQHIEREINKCEMDIRYLTEIAVITVIAREDMTRSQINNKNALDMLLVKIWRSHRKWILTS